MKRIISALTIAVFSSLLSLATAPANAGIVLSATTFGGTVDGLVSSLRDPDAVEAMWPVCDVNIGGAFGCVRRVLTLGPGLVEDVKVIADIGWNAYPGETYLNLWHDGIDVTLVYAQPGPFTGRVVVTFDDDASIGVPSLLASGPFRPREPLSAFDGLNAAGDWVITFADFDSSDRRTLYTATLLVTVPEPATLPLLGLALAGLGFARRRKLH